MESEIKGERYDRHRGGGEGEGGEGGEETEKNGMNRYADKKDNPELRTPSASAELAET